MGVGKDKTRISITFENVIYDKLKEMSEKENISIAKCVNILLHEQMKTKENKEVK
ncbi:hypothetical protein [Romboutsia sp.]|uniref:hypothetical protein n=1 Tax=Romboutsia sp. TaxID=1965302 RepID=UPI002BFE1342|nr:hypothetical protein [Romboutsia sp.]HSQ88700.1 hypothetical protein [Romboutsia sp.]